MNRICIISGMPFEVSLVQKLAKEQNWGPRTPELGVAGIGAGAGFCLVQEMRERGVTGLVSFGVAGGLDPGLESGALLLPRKIYGSDGQEFETSGNWHNALSKVVGGHMRLVTAPMFSSADIIGSVEKKAEIHRKTGAVSVDMESAVLASLARKAGLHFLVIRSIVDHACQAIPSAISQINQKGSIKYQKLFTDIIAHPSHIKAVLQIAIQSRIARKELLKFCRIAGPDFAVHTNGICNSSIQTGVQR